MEDRKEDALDVLDEIMPGGDPGLGTLVRKSIAPETVLSCS